MYTYLYTCLSRKGVNFLKKATKARETFQKVVFDTLSRLTLSRGYLDPATCVSFLSYVTKCNRTCFW